MLESLLKHIEKEYQGCVKPLNQVPKSCCSTVDIPVVDFDLVKDSFCERNKIEPVLKSVDAIVARKSSLFLIEMKIFPRSGNTKWKDFMEGLFFSSTEDNNGRIVMKSDVDCAGKIIDTLLLLLSIAGQAKFDSEFYTHFLNPQKTKIKPLILTDISDEEFLTATIAYPNYLELKITSRVESKISFINCSMLEHKLSS